MRRSVVAGAVALALLAGFAYWVGNVWEPAGGSGGATGCRVQADGDVWLEQEQLANAATIAATGVRLDMPERATVVALATAWQESTMRNLPHLGRDNDHDSIGLFQQRPSQGWGSEEQISDPRYAAERFYVALAQVGDWQAMRLTDAAQRVQRSAFPDAYQKWEDDAAVLASALLGRTGAAVTCHGSIHGATGQAGGDAELVRQAFTRDWGAHVPIAVHDDDSVQIRVDDESAGWRYAHWLVAHAHTQAVHFIHYGDLVWRAERGEWEPAEEYTDHVRAFLRR